MNRKRAIRVAVVVALLLVAVWLVMRSPMGLDVEPGSTLVLELSGDYVEGPEPPIFARILGERRRPFVSLLSTLSLAERDDRLAAVVLRIRELGIGWGKAQEIRDAIGRLRSAGRKTVAYLDMSVIGGGREYYVATAADEIYLSPAAIVPVLGLAAEYMFLGGAWEKIGVVVEAERVGRYKTAVDSFTATEMSEAHREMANSLLDSIDAQFVGGIAEGRGLEESAVRRAIDSGPVLGSELLASGLIDGIRHFEELDELSGPVVKGEDYAGVDPSDVGFEADANFALIYGSGSVVSGRGRTSRTGAPVFASQTVSEAIESAAEDPDIAAIILRIDSPGGSPLASEEIWYASRKAKEAGKPLIASFSDVAASGGYYAAMGCDAIVAPPGALTGSIGVFVLRPVLTGLFEKLGIGITGLTRGQHADLLLSGELSPGARQRLRAIVTDTYDLFVTRVAEGRELPRERVDALGQGRVWTGAQAVDLGLVDELGGLHVAVDRAKRELGLDEDAEVLLLPFPKPRQLVDELRDLLQGRAALDLIRAIVLPDLVERLGSWSWVLELPTNTPLLVPPFLVDIR